LGFPGGSAVKNLLASAGDTGSIPGSGRSPGGGLGSPLQYSCLENPMDEETGGLQFPGLQRVTQLSDSTATMQLTELVFFWGGGGGETTVSQHVQREKKLVSFETSITHLTVSYIFIALLLSWGYFVIFKLMVKSYFSYQ